MIKFELNEYGIEFLKALIKLCNNYLDGPQGLYFDEKGVSLKALDSKTGSIFVLFDIHKEFFFSYELTDSCILFISLEDFKKVLSISMNKEEEFFVFKYDNDASYIDLYFRNLDDKILKRYEITLKDSLNHERENRAEEYRNIPLQVKMRCQPGILKQIIDELNITKERDILAYFTININNHMITYENTQNLNLRAYKTFSLSDTVIDNLFYEILFDDEIINEIKINYDLDYINKLSKIDLMGLETSLEFGNEKPIRITISLHEHISFMLVMAPIMENDQEL